MVTDVLIGRLFFLSTMIVVTGCSVISENLSRNELVADSVKMQGLESETSESRVMYGLMVAEFAGQRGQYSVALENYIQLAKQTKDSKFAERAAKIALYIKDASKANEAISLWIKQSPQNLTARKLAVLNALKDQNKHVVVDQLTAMLKLDPAGFEKNVLEFINIVQSDKAIQLIYDVLEDLAGLEQSNRAIIYFVQSELSVEDNKIGQAEEKIQQVLELQPNWEKAILFQAQLAVMSGNLNKAKLLLKTARDRNPGNNRLSKMLAQTYVKSAEYDLAENIYKSLILDNPKDGDARLGLALMYLQSGKDKNSENQLEKLLLQDEWKYQASFYLGKIEEQRENFQKAIAWFDKVSEGVLVPESAISAASLFIKEKKWAEAEARLNELTVRFPKQKDRIILLRIGLYGQRGQYNQAFYLLSDELLLQPDRRDLLYTRALMAERLGKFDVLEIDLKKILKKYPDDAEALNALGYSLLSFPGRYDEAENYLQQAIKLRPDEAVIIDSYGWLQFKLGNFAKALEYLSLAYSKQQESEIAAHLADVLWKLGRKEEAKKIFNKAKKISPENEHLMEFERRVLSEKK